MASHWHLPATRTGVFWNADRHENLGNYVNTSWERTEHCVIEIPCMILVWMIPVPKSRTGAAMVKPELTLKPTGIGRAVKLRETDFNSTELVGSAPVRLVCLPRSPSCLAFLVCFQGSTAQKLTTPPSPLPSS